MSSERPTQIFDCLKNGAHEGKSYDIWVDGSFKYKHLPEAGVGIIVAEAGTDKTLFTMAYNTTNLSLQGSKYAELWAATLALKDLQDINLRQLNCDNSITTTRIKNLRDDIWTIKNAEKFETESKEEPILFEQLKQGISHHPDLEVRQIKRKKEKIPRADKLAHHSSQESLEHLFNSVEKNKAPCLYTIINSEGEPRQIFFFDTKKNYDIPKLSSQHAQKQTQHQEPRIIEL